MTADELIANEQRALADEVAKDSSLAAKARIYSGPDGKAVDFIVSPDLDEQQFRLVVRERAAESNANLVSVSHECWFVTETPDMDEPTKLRLRMALALGQIDQQPERKEKIILYVESASDPVRRFDAEILSGDGGRRLGPWVEQRLTLPRPNFKRYLPETQWHRATDAPEARSKEGA